MNGKDEPMDVVRLTLKNIRERIDELEKCNKSNVTKDELALHLNPLHEKISDLEVRIKDIETNHIPKWIMYIISILLTLLGVLSTIIGVLLQR